MADRVADLMEARLGIKGDGLAEKLSRSGRLLPRRVMAAAEILALNDQTARIPKLFRQVDQQASAQAYDACVRYLQPLGAGRRRAAYGWAVLRSALGGLAVTCVAGAALLVWRGYL